MRQPHLNQSIAADEYLLCGGIFPVTILARRIGTMCSRRQAIFDIRIRIPCKHTFDSKHVLLRSAQHSIVIKQNKQFGKLQLVIDIVRGSETVDRLCSAIKLFLLLNNLNM